MFARILTTFLIISTILLVAAHLVHADEIQDLQNQIDALNKQRELSVKATKPLEGQLDTLQRQLAQIQASLDNLSLNIKQKQKELDLREEKLVIQQALLETRVRAYYIRSYLTNPLIVILSSVNSGDLFRELSYSQSVTREDKQVITSITSDIEDLLTQKQKLEKDKARLASIQIEVDKNASFLGGEIKKAKAFQANLSNQIAQLSARQQEILAQRLSSLGIPLFASSPGACSSDLTNGKDPGFSGGFGLFTYGVPNRVGLSQYGAFGRARSGQNAEAILKAYYNFDSLSGVDQGIQIHVSGNSIDWTGSLEDYVKRIYEVPDSWGSQGGMEALKAQAIAARSYVLAYTNKGQGSICPTDQCQVFQTNEKGGNWSSAVSQTAGQVMIQGGSPIKAWFSSTHGGYTHSSSDIGWGGTSWTKNAQDTTGSVSSFSDLKSSAYDKDSPWFYCDWGVRSSYGGTAWLKSDEMADIVNVILLVQNQSDTATKEHLYQTDKPNPAGTDTWSADRVRQELGKYMSAYNSISSMSVSIDFGSGKVTSVNISGDGGQRSISGDFFKTYFNLRAPANIQIVGPLYNIEQR